MMVSLLPMYLFIVVVIIYSFSVRKAKGEPNVYPTLLGYSWRRG